MVVTMSWLNIKNEKTKDGFIRRFKKAVIIMRCFLSGDKEKIGIGKTLLHIRGLVMYPYDYMSKYDQDKVEVMWDEDDHPYVIHSGKRLYLQKGWTKEKCSRYYNNLRIEQDKECTHKYLTEGDRYPDKDDIVADLGAAEGIFALDVIECIKKLFLFEGDEAWIIPLTKTFEPWKDKVVIVKKYVSDIELGDQVSLDDYFKDEKVTYIKADIEGSEEKMLQGASRLLDQDIKKALICTYHKEDDEVKLKEIMKENGFDVSINPGYLVMTNVDDIFRGRYLRRGVMFAQKDKE